MLLVDAMAQVSGAARTCLAALRAGKGTFGAGLRQCRASAPLRLHQERCSEERGTVWSPSARQPQHTGSSEELLSSLGKSHTCDPL